jgi:cytoskeletal protein RodZ
MSLGSLINQARKSAGLSVEELSASTNIRSALLKEIELDNFKNCGGETYARGHIRNIATKLGVDPQIFITAFEEEQMQVDRSMKDLLLESNVMRQQQDTPKVSWKILASISVGSLLVVAIVQIVLSNTKSVDIPKPIATTSAKPADGTGVELVVTATRAQSWLSVSDASGQILFNGTIALGTTKTFRTDVTITAKFGNAGGVDLTVNGKKVDSIGENGEVVSVSYGVDS